MRTLLAALWCLVVLGCSSEPPTPADMLIGKWWIESPGDFECGLMLGLQGGDYEFDQICRLESGALGVQVEAGSYETAGDRVTFHAQKASCPDFPSEPEVVRFEASEQRLKLTSPVASLVFERVADDDGRASGGGAIAVYGCWDGDTLIDHPVQDI